MLERSKASSVVYSLKKQWAVEKELKTEIAVIACPSVYLNYNTTGWWTTQVPLLIRMCTNYRKHS